MNSDRILTELNSDLNKLRLIRSLENRIEELWYVDKLRVGFVVVLDNAGREKHEQGEQLDPLNHIGNRELLIIARKVVFLADAFEQPSVREPRVEDRLTSNASSCGQIPARCREPCSNSLFR